MGTVSSVASPFSFLFLHLLYTKRAPTPKMSSKRMGRTIASANAEGLIPVEAEAKNMEMALIKINVIMTTILTSTS